LGLGDTDSVYIPTLVKELENEVIVKVACGRNHTLFLNDQGIVFGELRKPQYYNHYN